MAKTKTKIGKREKEIRNKLCHLLRRLISKRLAKSSLEEICKKIQTQALPLLKSLGGEVSYRSLSASTARRADWKVKRGQMLEFLRVLGRKAAGLLELNSDKFNSAIKSKKFELAQVKSLVRKKVGKPYIVAKLKTRKG